jgi:hypothetical protein
VIAADQRVRAELRTRAVAELGARLLRRQRA